MFFWVIAAGLKAMQETVSSGGKPTSMSFIGLLIEVIRAIELIGKLFITIPVDPVVILASLSKNDKYKVMIILS